MSKFSIGIVVFIVIAVIILVEVLMPQKRKQSDLQHDKPLMAEEIMYDGYEIPPTLKKLKEIDYNYLLGLHLFIDLSYFTNNTPLSALPFASIGGNGTHFAFLTDFQRNIDLENTPIIIVSPTDDPPIRLIARNIKEFLSLVVYLTDATLVDFISRAEDEAEYISRRDEDLKADPEEKNHREKYIQILKKEFKLPEVIHEKGIFDYYETIKKERIAEGYIHIDDDYTIFLGKGASTIKRYHYDRRNKNIPEIKSFLETASFDERKVFYAEATYHYILAADYDADIVDILISSLEKDGLLREAEVIKRYKQ